jgi:hypothetical protein
MWTYYPDEGTLNEGFRWRMDPDAEGYGESSDRGSGPAQPYTVFYKEAGDKTLTQIRIGTGSYLPCGATAILTISTEVYEGYESSSSSSEEDDPIVLTSSSYSSSSSSDGGYIPGPST